MEFTFKKDKAATAEDWLERSENRSFLWKTIH